jgi:acyl carrier protein
MPTIKERVIEIVCNKLDKSPDAVKDETRFVDDLQADSLELAELLMLFEDEFKLNIPQDDDSIKTVGDAVKYIEEQVTKKGA